MGFFSWKTADTEESIPACASGIPQRTVYLIQPNGQPPLAEPEYEGYGVFGGVDAYDWLWDTNEVGDLLSMEAGENKRSQSITVFGGGYLEDVKTGKRYWPGIDFQSFQKPLEAYEGKTPNELLKEGLGKPN